MIQTSVCSTAIGFDYSSKSVETWDIKNSTGNHQWIANFRGTVVSPEGASSNFTNSSLLSVDQQQALWLHHVLHWFSLQHILQVILSVFHSFRDSVPLICPASIFKRSYWWVLNQVSLLTTSEFYESCSFSCQLRENYIVYDCKLKLQGKLKVMYAVKEKKTLILLEIVIALGFYIVTFSRTKWYLILHLTFVIMFIILYQKIDNSGHFSK